MDRGAAWLAFSGEVLTFFAPGIAKGLRGVGRAVLTRAEEPFIGPTIGKAGFRTIEEFDAAVGSKYQQFVNEGYQRAMQRVSQGLIPNDPIEIGKAMDRYSRTRLRSWLNDSQGLVDGPDRIIQVNRRLYDPNGSGRYRVPDVRIPGARSIYDATIAEKIATTPQIEDFRAFSRGSNITIVRPSHLSTPTVTGSYGIFFR